MPTPLEETQIARIAARERRVGLIAGGALAVVALAVIVFALVAWPGASAGGNGVAGPMRARPAGAQAVGHASAPARHAKTTGATADPTGASGDIDVDRLALSAQSASLYVPLYRRASQTFGVNWRLIASIHQQETSFSSAPGTYRGLNVAGCCAGPMQFNVTNGPVSTWERFRDAYRRAARPTGYPHRTRRHPSVYDDFDAVMAAGALLQANGAGASLDGSAWLASYHYYGHDFTGLRYADEVLARAVGWSRRGLCAQCAVDEQLAARFDASFAGPYRAELVAADRAAPAKNQARERARRGRAAHRRAQRLQAKRGARARQAAAKKKTKTATAKVSDPPSGARSASRAETAPPTAPVPSATAP